MSWRLARALVDLRAEIDARWPNRDRRSDGTIGDTAHAATKSDHNPNSAGVVRAADVDVDGIPAAWLAEHLRKRGRDGDSRLTQGGYVIFNRRIASDVGGWAWRAYTGVNPHTSHVHVSVAVPASGYDVTGSWGVKDGRGGGRRIPRHRPGSRVLRLVDPCMRGTDVRFVQRWVGADHDGVFGKQTQELVKRWQAAQGLAADGVVGARTWASMRVTSEL